MIHDVHMNSIYLPIGAHLRPMSDGSVELPDHNRLQVSKTDVEFPAPDATHRIDQIIATAKLMLGTPYVWGGRTTQGVDCSGITGSAYQTAGIILPRDADQQALCGTLVATRNNRAALAPGDLLFFISNRGQIHHVALYLGKDQFLEATTPVAKISSFNPKDPNYAEKRDKSFAFAKRVLQ
jgi:cell wall-associated NlpC family hydrolase